MLALQLLACFFLLLSAAFCFGPRLAVYGPRAVGEMAQDGQVQFVGGFLTSVFVLVFTAPYFASVLFDGGRTISIVMLDVLLMSFSPV